MLQYTACPQGGSNVDGFLTSRSISSGAYSGAATFDYSSRGELLSASLPGGDSITYQHDPMGRRISKSVNGVVIEKYLWQGTTTLLAVYDGSDNLIQRFEYAEGRMPVAMTAGSAVYYLAYDQVGSLRVVTDSAGTVVKQIDYDSFGNILSDSNPTFAVPFGFAGGLHDHGTGLVRFGARDYDPATGEWTAKDPIDFGGGDLNLLSYVANDSVNLIDPFGEACIGRRKLDSLWVPWFLNGKEPFYHEQILYNDEVNSGFFATDDIRLDTEHTFNDYTCVNETPFNDETMRLAEANVAENWDTDWRLKNHNCQNYIDAVLDEYVRLGGQ